MGFTKVPVLLDNVRSRSQAGGVDVGLLDLILRAATILCALLDGYTRRRAHQRCRWIPSKVWLRKGRVESAVLLVGCTRIRLDCQSMLVNTSILNQRGEVYERFIANAVDDDRRFLTGLTIALRRQHLRPHSRTTHAPSPSHIHWEYPTSVNAIRVFRSLRNQLIVQALTLVRISCVTRGSSANYIYQYAPS